VRLWLSLVLFLAMAPAAPAQWRAAEPGWNYEFPRDHGNHPDFKTEWWYFTGNLQAADGREFGYQLTFFRQGIDGSGRDVIPLSRFVTRHVKFAHFTVSDRTARTFRCFQKLSRGAYGEAGFSDGTRLAWIDAWQCEWVDGAFLVQASDGGVCLRLRLVPEKPPVFHGADGISPKGTEPGQASHYYSFTRLRSEGTLQIGEETWDVTGLSWFDHEWATNQLGADQVGWDWFSLQFEDGSDLMLFQLRSKEGGRGAYSSGTWIDPDGTAHALKAGDFSLEAGTVWTSPSTGGTYPVQWKIRLPGRDVELAVAAVFPEQELVFQPVTYWEGAIRATGRRGDTPLHASGYLEMTGYAGPVRGMQAGR
jgi:predicted secreted hydrolase